MKQLTPHEISVMFAALGLLLAVARLLGEVAKSLRQPAVLGELLAGVLLGPTVLGSLWPSAAQALFPPSGANAVVLHGLATVAVALFLLVAGMEVNLGAVWRQGRIAIVVSVSGIVVPFALGFAAAWYGSGFLAREPGSDPLVFALFFATALSISALPVIAKTLMDLNLYRSDLGMTIMAAAIFEDFAGWTIFAAVLGLMGNQPNGLPVGEILALTTLFAVFMLTTGRWLIHRALPWVHAHASWPGGVLGLILSLTFLCAAFTEWVGVHAVFGAFIAGIAVGDSDHLRERTRSTIDQFVSFIFAPIFFASIGLQVDFISHFDLPVVACVLLVACLGKVLGCTLGATLAGMPGRTAWALGFGMNARGAMEIILGLLGLQFGLIGERLFVALVVMAIVTSVTSGPVMQRLLRRKVSREVQDFVQERAFIAPLCGQDATSAIIELVTAVAANAQLPLAAVTEAVLQRERMMPTGLGHGVAVPHAHLAGLRVPAVGVGLAPSGIDFGAPDGAPAHVIFLLLTPQDDQAAQLELIADIARTFSRAPMARAALQSESYTEFLALLRTREARLRRFDEASEPQPSGR